MFRMMSLGQSHVGKDQKKVGSGCKFALLPHLLTLFMASHMHPARHEMSVIIAQFLSLSNIVNKLDHRLTENSGECILCSIPVSKVYGVSLLGIPFKYQYVADRLQKMDISYDSHHKGWTSVIL